MYKISLITGDGIGPELSESVVSVLNTIHDKLGVKFEIEKLLAGDIALKQYGKALPDQTLDAIKKSDVCMKAPVGESAADVIVVDLDREHALPVYDVAAALVYSTRADDVKHTIAHGRLLMENRVVTGVDEARIRARFRELSHALRKRSLG